ncbi:MAG TPA: FAD-binding protein, partial [Oscillospiraceae bacterium]|nr:FAD-binding protein [Oscillospiraceae bacterium]
MDKIKTYNELVKAIPKDAIFLDEPMKNHTSIKTGGAADIMVIPSAIEDIQSVVKVCNKNNAPYFIMGNGSNLLVRDKGMRCIV